MVSNGKLKNRNHMPYWLVSSQKGNQIAKEQWICRSEEGARKCVSVHLQKTIRKRFNNEGKLLGEGLLKIIQKHIKHGTYNVAASALDTLRDLEKTVSTLIEDEPKELKELEKKISCERISGSPEILSTLEEREEVRNRWVEKRDMRVLETVANYVVDEGDLFLDHQKDIVLKVREEAAWEDRSPLSELNEQN